jgi:hypothetical protein
METWVSPLKHMFYKRSCASEKAGVARFYKVWQRLNPEKINRTIDGYPERLRQCRDRYQGLVTKY